MLSTSLMKWHYSGWFRASGEKIISAARQFMIFSRTQSDKSTHLFGFWFKVLYLYESRHINLDHFDCCSLIFGSQLMWMWIDSIDRFRNKLYIFEILISLLQCHVRRRPLFTRRLIDRLSQWKNHSSPAITQCTVTSFSAIVRRESTQNAANYPAN